MGNRPLKSQSLIGRHHDEALWNILHMMADDCPCAVQSCIQETINLDCSEGEDVESGPDAEVQKQKVPTLCSDDFYGGELSEIGWDEPSKHCYTDANLMKALKVIQGGTCSQSWEST